MNDEDSSYVTASLRKAFEYEFNMTHYVQLGEFAVLANRRLLQTKLRLLIEMVECLDGASGMKMQGRFWFLWIYALKKKTLSYRIRFG